MPCDSLNIGGYLWALKTFAIRNSAEQTHEILQQLTADIKQDDCFLISIDELLIHHRQKYAA